MHKVGGVSCRTTEPMSGNMSASDLQRMSRRSEQERMKQEQVFPGQGCVKGVRRNVLSWPEGGSNPLHALEIQKEFTSIRKVLPSGQRSGR